MGVGTVLHWLDACIKQMYTMKIAPIREIILQFASCVRNFTGKMEDEKEVEIIQLISSSKANMKSDINIQSALEKSQTKLIQDLFISIENRIGKEKIKNSHDYANDNYAIVNNLPKP